MSLDGVNLRGKSVFLAANKLRNISLIQFFEVGRTELKVDRRGLLEMNTGGFLGPPGTWMHVCARLMCVRTVCV